MTKFTRLQKQLIEFCGYKEGDNVLEPAKGLGAIYDKLKSPKDYCEIEEGKDYFDYHKKVYLVLTNPPYSIIDNFLKHTNLIFVYFDITFGGGK